MAKKKVKRVAPKAARKKPAPSPKPALKKPVLRPILARKPEVDSKNSKDSKSKAKSNGQGGQKSPVDEKAVQDHVAAIGPIKSQSGVDLTEKIKELVRLAQEQGYLTYGDINDALPDNVISPEDLDEIYSKLRNLEIEIVDQ